MEYKVVPFHPTVTDIKSSAQAAKELEELIQNIANQGWKFDSLESMTTEIKPTGCASLLSGGRTENTHIQLVIFSK